MTITCTKHGEVEARVDAFGDAWCHECLEEGVRDLLAGPTVPPPITSAKLAGVTSVKPTPPHTTIISDQSAGIHPQYPRTYIRRLPGTGDGDDA